MASVESLEIMFDHVNIALLPLQCSFLYRFILGQYYFYLLYIFISWTFQSSFQEIPENKVN